MRNLHARSALLGALTLLGAELAATEAQAGGGFFCSQAQPVNQAAERIIFSHDEAAGTVTAVIQIMYEGPSLMTDNEAAISSTLDSFNATVDDALILGNAVRRGTGGGHNCSNTAHGSAPGSSTACLLALLGLG